MEYNLEHTALYEGFCAIFNRKIESFVTANGQTIAEFYEDVAMSYKRAAIGKTSARLLDFIEKASNFKVWADSMRCVANLRALGNILPYSICGFIAIYISDLCCRYPMLSHAEWINDSSDLALRLQASHIDVGSVPPLLVCRAFHFGGRFPKKSNRGGKSERRTFSQGLQR